MSTWLVPGSASRSRVQGAVGKRTSGGTCIKILPGHLSASHLCEALGQLAVDWLQLLAVSAPGGCMGRRVAKNNGIVRLRLSTLDLVAQSAMFLD